MLEKQINGFIDYCKVSGFKDKSIESLSLNLNKFETFLGKIHARSIKKVTYRHLLSFVAYFDPPSIHTKKARVWALRQFFHFLKLQSLVDENIATAILYPKIEKTVPQFLTIDERKGTRQIMILSFPFLISRYNEDYTSTSFLTLPINCNFQKTAHELFNIVNNVSQP